MTLREHMENEITSFKKVRRMIIDQIDMTVGKKGAMGLRDEVSAIV